MQQYIRPITGGAAAALMAFAMAGCGSNSFLIAPPLVADPLPVEVEWIPSTPTAEQVVTIRVAVQNQGALPAKSFNTLVQVARSPCASFYDFEGETIEGTYPVNFETGLAAGEAAFREVDHNFNNKGGLYGVFLTVDEQRDLDENLPGGEWDGETNNLYRCNDVRRANGEIILARDETYITVNNPGGDDDDDRWWWWWGYNAVND